MSSPVYAPFSDNKTQLGRETTPGTAVAATHIWRGAFSMLGDARERIIVEEQIGSFTQAERSYDGRLLAHWNQPSTPLTFEQVCHILEAGVKAATPSAGPPYARVYNFPYTGTSVNTIKTYTIETGNVIVANDQFEMEYGFVEDFEFSGAANETWMMQSTWTGRQMTPAALTAALSVPTVNDAIFAYTKLYIDASGGTIGTTQKSGVLMNASVKVKTGLIPVPVGDGNLYFAAHKWTQPEITFSLTLELEDASIVGDERDWYRANVVRLIRLICEPSASLHLQIDLAAKYDSVGDYTNADGNTTVTLEGHAVASSADSLAATFTVRNGVATL
jgi:hypothetical protein